MVTAETTTGRRLAPALASPPPSGRRNSPRRFAVPFVPSTDPTTEVRLPAVGNAARSAAVTRTYGSRPSGTPALNASP